MADEKANTTADVAAEKETARPVGESSVDAVTEAFDAVRKIARKRGMVIPRKFRNDDSVQTFLPGAPKFNSLQVPGQTVAKKDPAEQKLPRGARATGPDGYAKRYNSMESFGSVLGKLVNRRGWSRQLSIGWIEANWGELVGETIAAHTVLEKVTGTTLVLSASSTAWATNLRMMQKEILATIAKHIGPNIVTELKIFGPAAPSWRYGKLHIKGRGPRDTYG